MRARTDWAISDKWLLWGIASYTVWALLAVAIVTRVFQPAVSLGTFVGVLGSLGLISSIGFSYVIFRVTDTQNNHSGREQALLSEAIGLSRSRAPKDDMRIILPLNSAEQDLLQVEAKSRERSGFLWALLTTLPYLGWIFLIVVLALLTEESTGHLRTEQPLLEDLDRTVKGLGSPGLSLSAQRQTPRNAGLFAIVSILTLGVFTLFWTFLLVQDQEDHFSYHAAFEKSLLQSLPNTGAGSVGVN
jgi:hypothetical protein